MKCPPRVASFVFNKDNEVTHAMGSLPDDFDSTVVHKRVNGEWVLEGIYANPKGVSVPVRWHKTDPNKILYRDNLDASTIGYYWVDAKTGKKELIYRDPRVDIEDIAFDEEDEVVWVTHNYDYPTHVLLKPENPRAKRRQRLVAAFPDDWSRSTAPPRTASSTSCVSTTTAVGASSTCGTSTTERFDQLLDPRPQVKPKDVPQTHAVKFKARDGKELVGLPDRAGAQEHEESAADRAAARRSSRPPRLLGLRHGSRDFANAGYAVLKINYRGSGGYGRDFQYQWYRHWGLEMQDDLEDGVLWAAKAGIADIDRVCIYGASYGGYAALMGVVKTPDRYKCAIGYVGVYDLNIMHKTGDVSRSRARPEIPGRSAGHRPADRAARSSTPNAGANQGARVPGARHAGRSRSLPALRGNARRVESEESPVRNAAVPRAGHGAARSREHARSGLPHDRLLRPPHRRQEADR